jgi:heme-degrading monooxygenase HmoA
MTYLRSTVASWDIDLTSATGQDMIRRIEEGGLAVFRQQPGFIRYRLMRADAHTTIAVAEWESEDLGRPGAQRYREWMQSSGIMEHLSLHTYDGPVVVAS